MEELERKAINLNFILVPESKAKHHLIRYWLTKAQIEQKVIGQSQRSSFFAVCHYGLVFCQQAKCPLNQAWEKESCLFSNQERNQIVNKCQLFFPQNGNS